MFLKLYAKFCSLESKYNTVIKHPTEEDDVCSQPADSCQLNIHLPGLNDTDSLSSATIDVQNVDLPQSTSTERNRYE